MDGWMDGWMDVWMDDFIDMPMAADGCMFMYIIHLMFFDLRLLPLFLLFFFGV